MSRRISVRELRNHTADVVKAVEGGEALTLTVSGRPVADIVPHASRIERMPAAALVAELDRLSALPSEPWPGVEATTDDPISGLDDG